MTRKIIFIYMFIFAVVNVLYCDYSYAQDFRAMPTRLVGDIDIKNFAKIDNNYYRSGQPHINQLSNLKKAGIKTLINLRIPFDYNKGGLEKQRRAANSLGMNYVSMPMDPRTPPTQQQLNEFFNIIDNPNNLPVLVYDANGQDRVGVMSALYRIRYHRWDYEQAYAEMKSFGYHEMIYPELKTFLKEYAQNQGRG